MIKLKNWNLMKTTFCQMHSHISTIQVLIFMSHYKCATEGNQPLILVEFVDSSSQQYMKKHLGHSLKVKLPSYPYLIHTLRLVRSWWQLIKLWHNYGNWFFSHCCIHVYLFQRLQYSHTVYKCWHKNIQNKILPG